MPGQFLPLDPATELADIRKRLTRLESYPPAGMQLLGANNTGIRNDVYAQTTAEGIMSPTVVNFTLVRPMPILVFGSMVMFSSGGTANYLYGH